MKEWIQPLRYAIESALNKTRRKPAVLGNSIKRAS